jgi:hypothetical protein
MMLNFPCTTALLNVLTLKHGWAPSELIVSISKANLLIFNDFSLSDIQATNQGVVGSIPASRTKLNKGLHLRM